VLQAFQQSFDFAKALHLIRSQLQSSGHPDYQSRESFPLNKAMIAKTGAILQGQIQGLLSQLESTVNDLTFEKDRWLKVLDGAFIRCQRLRMLDFRTRVQYLVALKYIFQLEDVNSRVYYLLPFVVQCFPFQLSYRLEMTNVVKVVLDELPHAANESAIGYLEIACLLVIKSEEWIRIKWPEAKLLSLTPAEKPTRIHVSANISIANQSLEQFCGLLKAWQQIPNSSAICPGSVLWASEWTTSQSIADFVTLAQTQLCSCAHIVGVEKLSARGREDLIKHLHLADLHNNLQIPVFLHFIGDGGISSFQHFSEESASVTNIKDLMKFTWQPSIIDNSKFQRYHFSMKSYVVMGRVGSGKSTHILTHSQNKSYLRCPVHEGFSVVKLKEKFDSLIKCNPLSNAEVVLHFDLSPHGEKLPLLGRFIYYLFFLGLVYDEETGSCSIISPNMTLEVFIELPEVFSSPGVMWPGVIPHWNKTEHPLLDQLPQLRIITPDERLIAIRDSNPFVFDGRCRKVAGYLKLLRQPEISPQQFRGATPAKDLECLDLFELGCFPTDPSKRVRSCFIDILSKYLQNLLELLEATRVGDDNKLIERTMPDERFGSDLIKNYIYLFIEEAKMMTSEAIFSIEGHPQFRHTLLMTVFDQFFNDYPRTLIFTDMVDSYECNRYRSLNKYFYCLNTQTGEIFSNTGAVFFEHIRASVAPAFNMANTAYFRLVLEKSKHVITLESLHRLCHLNARRSLGLVAILSGETGCGKSKVQYIYILFFIE
jgi:hypothetical protein